MQSRRFIELDIWRGLAVIGMVVFHGVYILNYFGVVSQQLFQGGWELFGNFVRFSFLLLVGISMAISYRNGISRGETIFEIRRRQIKRSLIVAFAALLVTVFTFIFFPEGYVRFGILHLIAVSIFVLSFVVERRYRALIIGISIFIIGQFFVWPIFAGALDSFPIFPWMSLPALGIFIGYFLYGWLQRNPLDEDLARFPLLVPVVFLGRHALKTYVLHVPILLLLFWLFRIIPL